MGPFDEQLVRLIRSIPPGRVVTYGDLARMLDDRLGAEDVGKLMWDVCSSTTRELLDQNFTGKPMLPCWRVISDAPLDKLSPIENFMRGDPLDETLYRLVVLPLIQEGMELAPPRYRIPAQYLFHWTSADELSLGAGSLDGQTLRARSEYFQQQADVNSDIVKRCINLTLHGPHAIGFGDIPAGFIYQIRPSEDSIAMDLYCPEYWEGIRTLHRPRYEEEDDEEPSQMDEVSRHIFAVEESLDDGRWKSWTLRPDENWDAPSLDDAMQHMAYAPLQPTRQALLDQFNKILELNARRIVFYVDPEQWQESPAPLSAWDPPRVLTHAGLVRQAPFIIRDAGLDDAASTWTLIMESVHFPERARTVIIPWPPGHGGSGMNTAGQLWWELHDRCSAWFDLYYSNEIPDDRRVELYTYGGWHSQPDGSWIIKPRA